MKYNVYCLVTKGHHHLILILACNWLYYVHKNFLLHNMEISSQKIMLNTKKTYRDHTLDHYYKFILKKNKCFSERQILLLTRQNIECTAMGGGGWGGKQLILASLQLIALCKQCLFLKI